MIAMLLFRKWNRMENLIHSQCVLISHWRFSGGEVTMAIESNRRIATRFVSFHSDEFAFWMFKLHLSLHLTYDIFSNALPPPFSIYCKISNLYCRELIFSQVILMLQGDAWFWNETRFHVVLIIIIQCQRVIAKGQHCNDVLPRHNNIGITTSSIKVALQLFVNEVIHFGDATIKI